MGILSQEPELSRRCISSWEYLPPHIIVHADSSSEKCVKVSWWIRKQVRLIKAESSSDQRRNFWLFIPTANKAISK